MLTLIERLEKAAGPDRELDLAIAQALVPDVIVMRQREDDSGADPYTHWRYTESIDAAVALVERCLPNAEVIAISRTASGGWGAGINGHVKTGAINGASALLIALLRALEQEP